MNRLASALLVATTLLPLHADDLPKAETILDHFIEVTGGKAAHEKIHSEVTKGTMEFVGKGIKGKIASYEAEPNKNFTLADLDGIGKVESGTDGDVFWERSAIAGPRIKSGDEREEILRASIFNPHLNWRKLYATFETAGSESVDGEDCYKLLLTPKTGQPVSEWYAKKSGLLLKTSSVHKTQMGDIPADSLLKDYKPVSGILMPFTRIDRFAGQEIQIRVDSIEFDSAIPKDRFELPEEIKALVRKDGTTHEKPNEKK